MTRQSNILYNPTLTVEENAKRNGVTEAAIRYYIKVNHLDRRFDRKQNIIDDCRKYLKKHPNASKTELHKKTGHSLSTIYQYWEYISSEKEMDIQHKKKKFRSKQNTEFRHPSVYLMKDSMSNCIKIGKSIQPLRREKTLQSEKPTLTMFLICPCGTEKNANEVEKYLHKLFNGKRVRGEWFDLNENDINIITSKYQWLNTEDFKKYCEDNNESNTDAHEGDFVIAVKHGLIVYEETATLCNNVLEKIKNGTLKQDEVLDINNFLKHYI